MPRPILATIDTQAMANNLALVTNRMLTESVSGSEIFIWAVIKAHAYGHGIKQGVRAFTRADGLAMLDLDEAIQCRELGWTKPILLLEGFFDESDLAVITEHNLTFTVHNPYQLDVLERAKIHKPVNVFLKLNSGMHRLGFQPDEFDAAYARLLALKKAGKIDEIGKMTHFAKADEDPVQTKEQLDLFKQITDPFDGPVSVCNSAATLTPGIAASFHSGVQWVRPGICLYGSSPFADQSASFIGLQPAMTLSSQLISTHLLKAGESIGYGHVFTADHDIRVGIVACGYADGYPRHAVSGTPITVAGIKTRLVGRVSMDMLAVDLEPVPEAKIGSAVVLWGKDGPPIDDVATACGTIAYELMCALAPRVPREFI